jgi:hypothetical protein
MLYLIASTAARIASEPRTFETGSELGKVVYVVAPLVGFAWLLVWEVMLSRRKSGLRREAA